ncbi:hypothetical protein BT96DRAFT_1003196 [Gymnopus androsaceus JB14]|uniref:PHD-type domain-containing protein n=1 Tax=Gymnopus androsaceus JB14 TaxID=1447944 RepID=A0A6A4GUI9_9AGAR|nr:hypothetical protein BT96DRAFT_1003196 [Gymnopus androsaceus JB14]
MMNVNAIAGKEFFGMRQRSSISDTNTAISTKQQQQRGNSPALSTKQQQQRFPPTPSRDISAGQASRSTAVRLVNGYGHEIDGNGMLLLSPTAALEADGRRISGSGSGSVNGHGAGSAGGVSGENKSSAGQKSLGGRSTSPVASATSSGRQTAPHSSTSASSSAGPSNSTIPAKQKQPPSSAPPTVPSASKSNSNDNPDKIRCICGYTNNDGWSIGCNGCGRWVHGVCFRIKMKDKENFFALTISILSVTWESADAESGSRWCANISIPAPLTSTAASSPATSSPLTAPPAAAPPVNPALGRTLPSGPRALHQLQQRQDAGARAYPGDRNGGGNMFPSRGAPYNSRDRDRFRDCGGDFGRDSRDRDRDQD